MFPTLQANDPSAQCQNRWIAIVLAAFIACLKMTAPASAEEPTPWAKRNLPELFQLYQEFHKAPELSLKEEKTGMKVGEELRSAGLEVTSV